MDKTGEQTEKLVITREFDAPRERVWQAWTDPELFRQWWGPKIFTCPVAEIDLRVGGRFLAAMRSPEGEDYWTLGVFEEIVPPERLVYLDSFSNPEGEIVDPAAFGFEGWPMQTRVTVTFEDVGGRTRMTLVGDYMPAGEPGEMASQGWNEQFDKLAALVG